MAQKKNISFEEALEKLETAVEKLRSGECSLEESIKIYEDSVQYYELCDRILKDARQKIEIYRPQDGTTEEFHEH